MCRVFNKLRRVRRGFTLIESAMVTVIVGVAFTAMLQLITTGTSANSTASELTTAVNLANNIHELTQRLSFTDAVPSWGMESGETKFTCNSVEDLNGQQFSPPVDASRTAVTGCDEWTQKIKVQSIDSNKLTTAQPTNNPITFPMARVTVTIVRNSETVYEHNWIVVNTN